MRLVFVGSAATRAEWASLATGYANWEYIDVHELLLQGSVEFSNLGVLASWANPPYSLAGTIVWYNPGSFELLVDGLAGIDSEYGFLKRQFEAWLQFLEEWLAVNARCIDSPIMQRRWSNKVRQLAALAQELPLATLHSRISCDHGGSVGAVAKHLSESRLISDGVAFFSQVITPKSAEELATAFPTPYVRQEIVAASHEFRTFCFRTSSVTVKIPRPPHGDIVDVHNSPSHLSAARLVGSEMITPTLRELQRVTGLQYFAVDYFLIEEGLKIMEVNPVFTWDWLSTECTDAIREAVAHDLMHH